MKKIFRVLAFFALLIFAVSVEAAIARNPVSITNARWYPLYHIAALNGWVNDPNGFCTYNGDYHFFYQHYPYATHWGPMHWGHVVSKDLVHWKHLPIALEPDHIYDASGGCFSGSGIEKDGKLYLMYTGHVDLPIISPEGADRIEYQNIAVSNDGIRFEKIKENPVIYAPKSNEISQSDFRDPKVWEHNGKYYALVGSRTPTADPEGNKYLNWHQSVYMLGNLNYDTGIFTHNNFNNGKFEILDYGFDFYAPQITQTLDGRTVLIGWLDMWAGKFPEDTDGRACMMTVPRELHVVNGKLIAVPVPELKSLRTSEVSYKDCTLTKKSALEKIGGETGELIATIDAKKIF